MGKTKKVKSLTEVHLSNKCSTYSGPTHIPRFKHKPVIAVSLTKLFKTLLFLQFLLPHSSNSMKYFIPQRVLFLLPLSPLLTIQPKKQLIGAP